MTEKATYEIDGARFSNLEGFFDEISRSLIPGAKWGRNLDAFHDILAGGFGTPDGGFVLRWKNSSLSRQRLGYPEMVRLLNRMLWRCHPSNRPELLARRNAAKKNTGRTLFDWLLEIIRAHGEGGDQPTDGVVLILE